MSDNNGRAYDAPPGRVMRHSLSRLGSDVITLVELQTALLQAELRDWSKSFTKAVIAIVAALVLLLASAPVLLIGLGYLINQSTVLSLAASMLIAGGVGVLLAAICVGIGVWLMNRKRSALQNFSSELKQNVTWLKQVLSHPNEIEPARGEAGV